jgi:nucleotide-binding universal stress UspA family protein
MVSAIVAATAGVLGLMLGRYWDNHSETRRWRRDQRIRIYEQFASAYYASREAYRSVALLAPGTPQAEDAASRALDLGIDFNRTLIALWLHGSANVALSAHELDIEVNKLFMIARSRQFSWEAWRVERGPAERALERFTESVRAELGLPGVRVAVRIDELPTPTPPAAPS